MKTLILISLLIPFSIKAQDFLSERHYLTYKQYVTKQADGTVHLDSIGYVDQSGNPLRVRTKTKTAVSSITYSISGGVVANVHKIDSVNGGTDDFVNIYLGRNKLKIDIKADDCKLNIYPWPYPNEDNNSTQFVFNKYFKEHEFYIDMPERRRSSVHYGSWQYGALTIPAKVYVAGQMTPINNVTFDVNVNLMIGRRWGRDRYVFLPNSKDVVSLRRAFSVNWLVGVSKVDLDSAVTTSRITDKHSLAAITSGIAFGYQYKDVGVYMASGLDLPIGRDSHQWNFYLMPWVGFGVGVKID